MTNDETLLNLSRPFPKGFIHSNPSGGGSYVTHGVVKQRLLHVFGHYDFELVEVVRGHLEGKAPDPSASSKRGKAGTPDLVGAVVGAVCRLSVTWPDGERCVVEDVGDCEDPHNWPHDGARLKDAMSDALKRCAQHMSVGLHLWCKDGEYRLHDAMQKRVGGEGDGGDE